LLLPGGLALLAGLDGALLLLGLPAPLTTDRLPQVHGPLLVLGFVGTVVALERAVALRRWWGFAAPAGLGAGAVLLLTAAPLPVGQAVLVGGTLAQLALYGALWRRQESGALALQALGAVLAAGSALLWWGGAPVASTLPWLAGFLVLTIAGERLELARVGAIGERAERLVLILGSALFAAVVATVLWPAAAHPLLGAALLALVGTLVVHDVARRTVRATGLPRYMAWCLLAGYAWLVVAGGIWLLAGEVSGGPAYDAVVHAVFLGFTLSMIMAHAPVILPAVLARPLPYRPAFYGPAGLLHGSLLLRVLGGDAYGLPWALQLGGSLNITAVLGFVGIAVWSGATAARRRAPDRQGARPAAGASASSGATSTSHAPPVASALEEVVR
jgi:hypothetical protein